VERAFQPVTSPFLATSRANTNVEVNHDTAGKNARATSSLIFIELDP
jgi:hypothetical protein